MPPHLAAQHTEDEDHGQEHDGHGQNIGEQEGGDCALRLGVVGHIVRIQQLGQPVVARGTVYRVGMEAVLGSTFLSSA